MSVAAIGAILGLLLAVVDIMLLRMLAARVDLAETKLALKVTGLVQLVLLPAMGWFVAPLIAGE